MRSAQDPKDSTAYECQITSAREGALRATCTTEEEIIAAVENGERFAAKFGRVGFRRNSSYNGEWRGRFFRTKQVEAIAVEEEGWLVITVIVRFS